MLVFYFGSYLKLADYSSFMVTKNIKLKALGFHYQSDPNASEVSIYKLCYSRWLHKPQAVFPVIYCTN